MSFSLRYLKNKSAISKACLSLIQNWQGYSSGSPCEDIIMRCVTRYMDEHKDLISAQRETDREYLFFVKQLISKVTFEMLISHLYTGRILPTIYTVHDKAMKDLVYVGYISEHEYEEDKESIKRFRFERMPQAYRDQIKEHEKIEQKLQETYKELNAKTKDNE